MKTALALLLLATPAYAAEIFDTNRTPGHIIPGPTKGADRVHGNGVPSAVFLGDGNDWCSQGIVDPAKPMYGSDTHKLQIYWFCYGGLDNEPTLRTPQQFSSFGTSPIGGLHNDGNDEIHIGKGGWAVPGSGNNLVVIHGNARRTEPFKGIAIAEMNMGTDRLVMDRSDRSKGGGDGIDFSDVTYVRWWKEGARQFAEVRSFIAHSYSLNSITKEQYVMVDVTTDQRGGHTPLIVEYFGSAGWDDVVAELNRRVGPGRFFQ